MLARRGRACWNYRAGIGQRKARQRSAQHTFKAERILLSLDYDEAGAKAAYNFWPQAYGKKVIRWPTPEGKDASEAYQKGINIRAWVEAGLE